MKIKTTAAISNHKNALLAQLLGLLIPLGIIGSLLLTSCQTAEPPPAETVLRLKLADSLSRYDIVIVKIVDRLDTTKILQNIWDAAMPNPSQLPHQNLKFATNKDFIVKVEGYSGGNQLFLQTLIFYEGGKKSVLFSPVPAYKPRNRLKGITTSVGALTPKFQADSVNYSINVPAGETSVSLTLPPQFDGASVLVAGEIVKSGNASKPITLSKKPDTIAVLVTDSSQGTAYTHTYSIVLLPSLSSQVSLVSLIPSSGELEPAFQSDFTSYSLYVKDSIKTITFTCQPTDPGNTILTVMGLAAFPGIPSQPIFTRLLHGFVVVEVRQGAEVKKYQVAVFSL